MTKAEQARIVAWRLRILRHAEQQPRYVAQTCGLHSSTSAAAKNRDPDGSLLFLARPERFELPTTWFEVSTLDCK